MLPAFARFCGSLAAIAASSILIAWVPSPAFAQSRPGGSIVYTHAPDGAEPWPVLDIYIANADGTSPRALTTDGHSHTPSWAPDGRSILFIHNAALTAPPPYRERPEHRSNHPIELYAIDADGRNRRLIRRLEPVIHSAVWSPDGKSLAISGLVQSWANLAQTGGQPMRAGLWILPGDGQGEPRLLFREAATPAWSPDGRRLAFSVEQPAGQWAVHVANVDGTNDTRLTDPALRGGMPAWSPDGRWIAFSEFADDRRQQIFLMETDGSEKRQLTSDPNWSCGYPTWSPQADRLVFSCRSAGSPCGMGFSSVGTPVPPCDRRLFTLFLSDPKSAPVQITEHDAAFPVLAPR